MLPLCQAQEKIVSTLDKVGTEVLPCSLGRGRVLSQDIVARRTLPPFDNSAMDGYALHWEDTLNASMDSPVELIVPETISAGAVSTRILQSGEAARIFTGAPLPQGATAVVMQENTKKCPQGVQIVHKAKPQEHIRFKGEDIQSGDLILHKGSKLAPGELAMLAAQGILFVEGYRKPRVAIVPTGNEVKPLDHTLKPGEIPNSNSPMLAAQIEQCGAIALQQPIAPDDPHALLRSLTLAAQNADLILTTGGVSVGEFDYVKSTLEAEGEINFWKVAIKPGKPLVFGSLCGTPLLGLPGNPASSFVTFELFARPAILKLAGLESPFTPQARATLTHSVKLNKTREQFLRSRVSHSATGLNVRATSKQGSGQLSSMTHINSLAQIPIGDGILEAGSTINVIYLPN